jgi:hypothetical protein
MLDFLNNISGVKVFFIIMICLLLLYIQTYVTILILYKPLFQWWKDNNGSPYDKIFNMMTVATANYSTIMYGINKLKGGPLNKININQLQFLIGRIFPFMIHSDTNGKQVGILTPRAICESILLSPTHNDSIFNFWFKTAKRGGMPIQEGANLNYTRSESKKSKNVAGETYYTYEFTPDDTGVSGIYPRSPTDTNAWTGLILEWLGPGWGVAPDEEGNIMNFVPITADADYSYYMDRGDNFLARYRIFPDSPLVTYFCNGKYSSGGMRVDSTAFSNLIAPQGGVAGGWIGFLNGTVNQSTDSLNDLLYTSVEYTLPNSPSCTPSNTAAGVGAGVSSFLAIGVMAAMVSGPALIFTVLAAAVVGTISGLRAGAGTC